MGNLIKVSANSRTNLVAGAIAGIIRDNGSAEMQAIGAGAVNQAVKALAIAIGYLANDGIDIGAIPALNDIDIDGRVVTAVRLSIFKR